MISYDFSDQTVIVTGGTSGIGKGIVKAFLEANASVIATYANNDARAIQMKEELNQFSSKLDLQKFDVSSSTEVSAFYKYVEENYSSVEVLVNNSGIRQDAMLAMMEDANWDRVLDVNLKGTYLMSKSAVIKFLNNRYGRIINISSVGADLGIAGQTNYSASKAGQMAFSKSLSKEVAKKGITVNNICPGFVDTELLSDLPPEQLKEYKKMVPMKRIGKTEDVAIATLFLASKQASYITGTSIYVTG